MNIDVSSLIKEQVKKLNDLFEKAAKATGKQFKPYVFEDYKYLKESRQYFGEFALPYFLTYSVLKDVEYRIQNPYPGTIWYWKKNSDQSKEKDFLSIQTKLMYDTLNSYLSLLKSGNFVQALILFRSYIEYSSQFYACLLDYDFFQKYTETNVLDDEYKALWFKNLRPEKVLSKIRGIHAEINKLQKEKKVIFGAVYSRRFKPFDSKLRGHLYDLLSGLAHGSYPVLVKEEVSNYALVFLCSAYLVESQAVIDEITSVYFQYSPDELFNKWITIEIYLKSREPKAELFMADENI